MVRQESAKLLYVGSIPTRASSYNETPKGMGRVEAKALLYVEKVVALFANEGIFKETFPL